MGRRLLIAANRAVRAAPWLGPEHAPLVEGLRAIARDMDTAGVTAAGMSQYRQLAQAILDARGPATDDQVDDPDLRPLL